VDFVLPFKHSPLDTGNQYGFSNVCQKEVQLCFSQARRIKAEEDLPLDETLNNKQTTNMANGNGTGHSKDVESARTVQEGEDEDEEEDSPPPAPKRRPVAKKTVRG
jgi:hypothetical protein